MKPAKIYNCELSGDAKSDTLVDKRWTPAQVGRALKIVLYVGVAASFWLFDHYFGDNTAAEDALGRSDTSGPGAANDFSPWEPAP